MFGTGHAHESVDHLNANDACAEAFPMHAVNPASHYSCRQQRVRHGGATDWLHARLAAMFTPGCKHVCRRLRDDAIVRTVIFYRLVLSQTEVRLLESARSTISRRRIGILLSVSRAIQGQSSQQVTDYGAEKSAPKHHPPEIRKPLADEEIHRHWL
jgi:hypothetical protein